MLLALHVVSDTQVRCDIRFRYNTHHDNEWTKYVSSTLFFAGIEVSLNQSQLSTALGLNAVSRE